MSTRVVVAVTAVAVAVVLMLMFILVVYILMPDVRGVEDAVWEIGKAVEVATETAKKAKEETTKVGERVAKETEKVQGELEKIGKTLEELKNKVAASSSAPVRRSAGAGKADFQSLEQALNKVVDKLEKLVEAESKPVQAEPAARPVKSAVPFSQLNIVVEQRFDTGNKKLADVTYHPQPGGVPTVPVSVSSYDYRDGRYRNINLVVKVYPSP